MLPFPALSWTGFAWTAPVLISGFNQMGPVSLEVRVPLKAVIPSQSDAPAPSTEQANAFQFLLGDGAGIWAALLTAVRDRVPEWSEWPLTRVGFEVVLSRLTLLTAAWHGVAYIGYWLMPSQPDSWLTEHGAGITAHRYRVVSVGMGEESQSETAAMADLRKLKREHRSR